MMCKKCYATLRDQVLHLANIGYFRVVKAVRIIKDKPRRKKLLSRSDLWRLTRNSRLRNDDRHLRHVDISFPIIIGRTDKRLFILDGNHRASYCYYNKLKRYAYYLTEFETGQVFSSKPPAWKKFVAN